MNTHEQLSIFDFTYPKYKITKPIRLIELFAGIGAQATALKRLKANFETYKIVEFDKYAIASYNAVHNTNFEVSDITKINAKDLEIKDTEKYDYIMTYSYPCFTGESLVLTDKGYKQIKDIKVDDYVLTHDNTYKKVLKTFNNGTKSIWQIKGMGIDEILTTENHKFLVRTMYRKGHKGTRTFTQPVWKEVKDLTTKDYLGIAINQKESIPSWNGIDFEWNDGRKTRNTNEIQKYLNKKEFWWIIGAYIGNGWIRQQGGIIICDESKSICTITEKLDTLNINYTLIKERTAIKIHIPCKEWGLFVEPFGKGASNKRLTNTIIDLPINLLQSFLEGYFFTDGYIDKNKYIKVNSVSKELIYGVAQCVTKVYKQPYRIYKTKRKPTCVIEDRIVNQKDTYELVFKKDIRKQDKAFYENGYTWFPIREVNSNIKLDTVYDIEVENNHSFTVQNVIVHNCQDLSLAGKGEGMSKGSGTRSGLLWEVERLLDEMNERPQILLMENVPMVISKKHLPDFRLWCDKLESLGYKNYFQNLNTKNYGIPQNRNRTFMVSLLGNYNYTFPKETELKLRLKDFLEDEVDEKYFLSDKMLKGILTTSFTQGKLEKRVAKNGIIPTLCARDYKDPELVIPEATKKGYAKANEGDGVYIDRPHQKRGVVQKDMIQTIKTDSSDLGVVVKEKPKIKETKNYFHIESIGSIDNSRRAYKIDKVAPTLTLKSENAKIIYPNTLRIRKLTPKECWRLMGFNDDEFDKAEKVNSNSQLYKQAGNSIVVNVLENIFKELL